MTIPLTLPWISAGVPALVLAPMEGVTDQPMRAFLSQLGGFTFCVTEFVRISQTIPGIRVFHHRVPELQNGSRTPTGLPVQVQLLGGDPAKLARAAQVAVQAGARAVDLNFGCPARTINCHDGGATLLRHPDRIQAIVAAVCRAVPPGVPVSAKLRLGWDDPSAIYANAARAAEGGAAWITIHGRTKTQGYQPPPYWRAIGEVRTRLGIPVVANGEIWTLADLRRCRDETGCEHFMLGRGALADPSLARNAARELDIPCVGHASHTSGAAGWVSLVQGFIELNTAAGRTPAATVARIKQWLHLANHDGKFPWFETIKRQQSLERLLDHLSLLSGAVAEQDSLGNSGS